MIPDNQTNTIYFSELIKTDKRSEAISKHILSVLDEFDLSYGFLPDTNDIWARDYMPIQVNDTTFVEYRYDPDYLQGDSDEKETRELKTYPDIVCDAIGLKTQKTDIILDGGNVVKSKNAVILSDKVVWENRRSYSEKRLISKLHELFEVEKVVLIPWDDECEFGHADGMLRFIDEDTVLISGFYETADVEFKEEIIRELKKENLKWEFLRCADKEGEDNIAYINFLQTEDILLIPKMNRKEDDVAFEQLSTFYPGYAARGRINQVAMTDIFKFGGALNCITWTVKKQA